MSIGDLAIGFVAGAYITVGCYVCSEKFYYASISNVTLADIMLMLLTVVGWPFIRAAEH